MAAEGPPFGLGVVSLQEGRRSVDLKKHPIVKGTFRNLRRILT